MRDAIVALDLETTGLNRDEDAIIEIGAAVFENGELRETFSTLVNPGRSIPDRVTAITGIRTEDLFGAPGIRDVLPALHAFIGSRPVLGHRVDFDLGFLARYGIATGNLALDTYELASVLLPDTARYNLAHLSDQFDVNLKHAHRALDDALATGHLYWELWQRALALPLEILQEIVEAAGDLPWSAQPVFLAALQERSKTAFVENARRETRATLAPTDLFKPADRTWQPLRPNPARTLIDVDGAASIIERGGELARVFAGYEDRPQQVEMLRRVAEAFNRDEHLIIEAATGVGKSLGYLIPAVLWATLNNERVVISTATINLQDQLLNKDLPMLAQALDVPFRAAVVKGRNNYLCPRRLQTLRRRGPTSVAELRVLAKILVWLLDSDSGDRGEISLRGYEENAIWARLSAADEGCTLDRCHDQMHGVCPFYKARRAAEAAHVLVVNHALLLSDVQIGNRVLPDYRYLVIDEGHHLEDATTSGLSFQTNQVALQRQLDDLGDTRRGLLGDVIRSTRGSVPARYFEQIEEYVKTVSDSVRAMSHHAESYFATLYRFLDGAGLLRRNEYIIQVRITPQLRLQPGWEQVEMAWTVLSQFTQAISSAMVRLARGLGGLHEFDVLDYDDLLSSVVAAARHLEAVHVQLGAFTEDPDPNTIYWVEMPQDREQIAIHAAPLNVGPLLEQHIWEPKHSVVLTSATLRTNGTFDYLRDRLNAYEIKEAVIGSPFDYERAALVYVPTDMPDPSQRDEYQRYVERGLIELAAATQGRLLALFTSYAQLRQTAQAIAPRLALGNITVFDQSDGTSRQTLVEGFKQAERAVLLGTRSFWEGVDIPGDDLSALVIVRLPFAVPSDPIFAARSEQYENSFMQYAVPDAILRFRQGFGRLIRTQSDRGVVALFDNRVITKRYGQAFLDSLPACTVRRGPLADLPRAAAAWIDGERA
ncbi:MAG: DEAD/DEAH box helicase family protein [Anaerolineae bacterium]|nr:DEAD/DEAH box helicase family protein [Anaerolineae bacterium]